MKARAKVKTTKCCMCKRVEAGFGHNAQPASEGRCCTECNWTIVIPLRVMMRDAERDPELAATLAALTDKTKRGIRR